MSVAQTLSGSVIRVDSVWLAIQVRLIAAGRAYCLLRLPEAGKCATSVRGLDVRPGSTGTFPSRISRSVFKRLPTQANGQIETLLPLHTLSTRPPV